MSPSTNNFRRFSCLAFFICSKVAILGYLGSQYMQFKSTDVYGKTYIAQSMELRKHYQRLNIVPTKVTRQVLEINAITQCRNCSQFCTLCHFYSLYTVCALSNYLRERESVCVCVCACNCVCVCNYMCVCV